VYGLEGKNPQTSKVYHKEIDTSYLHLYGLHLLAGRNLSATDTSMEYLINLAAVKKFGFKSPQEALGKMIGGQGNTPLPIIGVVNDFHFLKFYNNIEPIALTMDKDYFHSFNIKLSQNPQEWSSTLKAIEQKWNIFYPTGSFTYHFYDENIAKLYDDERHLDNLVNLTMIISIVISCMGLFGLAVLTAFQRTKEIGIRKVLGASVPSIMGLLSKEYVRLVLISFVLATPITWLAMNKWLQNFAYRLPLHWWLFAISGILALTAALLTVGYQAWKSAKANPVISLRTE
jgi:ABC-type antimicrobial peptide transport system permease subunit